MAARKPLSATRGAEIRSLFAKYWSRVTNASARYGWGVFLLLVLGVAGELLGGKYLAADTAPRTLVQGFSDAFLVTSVLAVTVDPYLKLRMQHESGWHTIFGFLNPKAPDGLREAMKELAHVDRFYWKAVWVVHFAWHDAGKNILAVTMKVTYTGVNLDKKPYKPHDKPWVLASTEDYQSEYLQYSLHCPSYIASVDVHGDELIPYTERRNDGAIFIDEARLAAGRLIPPGANFEIVYQARMYRHANGYVPLQHDSYIENVSLTLTGPALSSLNVRITHPRQQGRSLPAEWKHEASNAKNGAGQTLGRATPGQITLVSWVIADRA